MNAPTVLVTAALGAGVLIDLPGLRHDIPRVGEPGPIERDLRWYGLTEQLPRGYELRRHDGIPLSPEWREQTELWDEALRGRLDRESRTEPEPLNRLSEPRASSIQLIIEGTHDPSVPRMFIDVEGDLRPDSVWTTESDAAVRNWLFDPSLPRYAITAPFSPEYWVRNAPTEPDDTFLIEVAAGESVLQWTLPMMIWGAQGEAYVWTSAGSRWAPVEIDVTNRYDGSTYELALDAIPNHLFSESITMQLHLSDGGGYNTPPNFRTFVAKIHISESRLPGDFNRDGTLTLSDLDAYSTAFAAEAPRADLNRDGTVDAEDLRIYLATFDANFRP
jgi:hypothetical protein